MASIRSRYNRWWWLWFPVGGVLSTTFAVLFGVWFPVVNPWQVALFAVWPVWCWRSLASFRCPGCNKRLLTRPNEMGALCSRIPMGAFLLLRSDCEWCGRNLDSDAAGNKELMSLVSCCSISRPMISLVNPHSTPAAPILGGSTTASAAILHLAASAQSAMKQTRSCPRLHDLTDQLFPGAAPHQ